MIIRKTKINWVIEDTSVIAFDKWQATVYHCYGTPDKEGLEEMKKIIIASKKDDYNSWVDVIDLAQKKGLIGYGTRHRPEWAYES